jgi:DNA invertase Pin-like site-specific DNA recombinase
MGTKFVSYIRVSTARQHKSGLGEDAQCQMVKEHLARVGGELVAEVVEVESGKRADRPKLAEAMRLCRVHNAQLLIAKLDRLSRSVAFISTLIESGVRFVAADMPEANTLTVHVMSSMAQFEREAISKRTKDALQAAIVRGTKLGGLRWDLASVSAQGRALGLKVRQQRAAKCAEDLVPVIEDLKTNGAVSLRQIADGLNSRGITTAKGGQWSAVQVQRLMERV